MDDDGWCEWVILLVLVLLFLVSVPVALDWRARHLEFHHRQR